VAEATIILFPSTWYYIVLSVTTPQLGFFITENVVIDVTVREMVPNIAPLHTFQIITAVPTNNDTTRFSFLRRPKLVIPKCSHK
jgi:hypothetical protein